MCYCVLLKTAALQGRKEARTRETEKFSFSEKKRTLLWEKKAFRDRRVIFRGKDYSERWGNKRV